MSIPFPLYEDASGSSLLRAPGPECHASSRNSTRCRIELPQCHVRREHFDLAGSLSAVSARKVDELVALFVIDSAAICASSVTRFGEEGQRNVVRETIVYFAFRGIVLRALVPLVPCGLHNLCK